MGTLLVGGEQQLEGRMGWDRITRKDGTMKIKQCGTGGNTAHLALQERINIKNVRYGATNWPIWTGIGYKQLTFGHIGL